MAKKSNKPIDITETGPQGYRQLQEANHQNLTGLSPEYQLMSQGIQQQYAPVSLYDARANAEQLVQSSMAESPTAWGESAFDEDYATEQQFQHLGDIRANNQPWYSQIANGIAKGALLAGTTFLDGTLGLLLGANTAVNEGRWSGLWDNDFSKAMQSMNEWSEQAIPNYYTEAEQNGPWYENIFTANFLGDKFIKNLGFTVGAFYSGGLEAGLLRGAGRLAMGAAKGLGASINTIKSISKASSHVASAIGALTSAVNEGRIEALNNSKDWYEATLAPIQDDYQQKRKAFEEIGDYDSMTELDRSYEDTLAKLNEDRLKMGNADLLMNIPILTASNLIQFGKMYANGFRTGKRTNNIIGNIRDGYRVGTTKATGVRKAILNPLSEGTEEISQGAASRISGNYYQTDVNNFYKAKTDPDAQQQTLDWWKSFAEGINETVNDGSAWEEFFIGSLTGALGMPRFRGVRNEQGKLQSPVTLEGGVLGDLRDNREQMDREQQIADYMNSRMQSPEFRNYYEGLSRHNYYQSAMNQAVQDDDEFTFKNAEHAQFISDISMFDAAGKIEDLKELINQSHDTSMENLESIFRNTTRLITAQEQKEQVAQQIQDLNTELEDRRSKGILTPQDEEALVMQMDEYSKALDADDFRDVYVGAFSDENGNPQYSTQEGLQGMIDKLTQNKDNMLDQIDDYVRTKIDLQDRLPYNIGNDQLEELVFLQTQVNNWNKRGEQMTPVIRDILTDASSSLRTLASASELAGNTGDSEGYNSDAEFIEHLVQDKTPKQLMQILSHPKSSKLVSQISNIIDAFGSDVISDTDKKDALRILDDIVKIGKSKDLYQKRLRQYMENPAEQVQVHEQARAQQESVRSASQDISVIDRINNSSVPDIVQAAENGDIDFDSLDSLLEGEESGARASIEQARDIIDTDRSTRNGLQQMALSGQISEQELQDAITLLDNSKIVSGSSDELLDLDTEAFNNPHELDGIGTRQTVQQRAQEEGWTVEQARQEYESIMNQRLDAAKNALSVVKTLELQRNEELSNIPDSTEKPVQGNMQSEQTGHDSVDRNQPVNTPVVQQDSAAESNMRLTDDILSRTGHSREQSPDLAKDFDNIFNYVDRAMSRGLDDSGVLDSIKGTQTYQKLDNLQYPMKSIVQNAIAVKRQGMGKPVAQTQNQAMPAVDYTPDTSASYQSEIDQENDRGQEYQSTEAYVESATREGTTTSMGKTDGTYNYWRPSTTELPIHRKRGDDTPYWQTAKSPIKERYQAVYEYLKSNGAFSRVNNNQVKKGDEVHFGISKELSDKLGKPVILLLDANNNVIGDLPMDEDLSFRNYAGLPELYAGASKWYQENRESLHADGNDIAVIPGYKSNVARNMIGKPQYTSQDERHTLNQISTVTSSDGTQKKVPFRLGIAISDSNSSRIRIMSDAGRSKSQGSSPLERTIITPLRAVKGQPFLLMPTSSDTRAFVPVPIMMPSFDSGNPSIVNSSLGQEIVGKVKELSTIPNNTDQIMKWINSMQELLAIPEIHVNFPAPSLGTEGRGAQELVVSIKRTGDTKQTIIFRGPQEQAADAVLKGLDGSMFQVSRKYINDTYNGRSYNEMIGELAETNLPIGATHTINDWYTIDPIVNRKQQKAHSPKSTRVNPNHTQGTDIRFQDVNGNSYYLTSSNRLYKENPDGHDTELLGDEFNYLKAHAYGTRIGETYTRPYDTPWGYYNPQTGKFQSKASEPQAIQKIASDEYNQISQSSSRIGFNESDHSYTVNGVPVDMSVTQWVHRNDVIEPETGGILGYLEVSGRIGTEIDRIARAFFEGRVYESPLFSKDQNEAVRQEVQRLKDDLDQKFGKDTWRAITDENMLRVAGTIQTENGLKTIAGTMDMLIQDAQGKFHIIDFKTKRAKVPGQHGIIGDTKSKYDTQVSMYARLLQQNNPLLKGRITGSYLAIFNNFYGAPSGGRSNENGTVIYTQDQNGQITATVAGKTLLLQDLPGFNPSVYNRLQLVDWDQTLPATGSIASIRKPGEVQQRKIITTSTQTRSKGRTQVTEISEKSRTVDREGTTIVELEATVISDSEKPNLVGRTISGGGLEIDLDSDIVDWKQYASGGTRQNGTKVTPDQVTKEEENDAKEQVKSLTESASGKPQPFKASKIFYTKDGRILARDNKGTTIYLKSDPLTQQTTARNTTPSTQSVQQSMNELFTDKQHRLKVLATTTYDFLKNKVSKLASYLSDSRQGNDGVNYVYGERARSSLLTTFKLAMQYNLIDQKYKDVVEQFDNTGRIPVSQAHLIIRELNRLGIKSPSQIVPFILERESQTTVNQATQKPYRQEVSLKDLKVGDIYELSYIEYPNVKPEAYTVEEVKPDGKLIVHKNTDFSKRMVTPKNINDYGTPRIIRVGQRNGQKPTQQVPVSDKGTQPQVTREEALASLKKMGLLNKKERVNTINKLSDDRVISIASMPKLKAGQILQKFDVKVRANMDSDAINDVFDNVMGSKPLNRQVVKQMSEEKSWSMESEIEKISKILPQLSEDGRVRIVNGLLRIAMSGDPAYAWGQFQNGMITLSDRAARGTVYHESFHFVTQTLLSNKELNNLYDSAEKQYGKLKRLELEEKLAEDFREFMQSYEDDGFFKNIFKTLKHIIKSLIGKETVTNRLFHDIRRGALASRTINTSDNTLYRKDPMTLTQELNNLRQLWRISHSKKFQDEMRRFNGKVNRDWGQAYGIIEKYGLGEVAYVFEGQYGAAKIGIQSLKEFTDKANRLKAQIRDSYESELSDDERLSNRALEEQETYYRRIEQYHREKLDYGRLNQEQKDYMTERGISLDEYNSMTPQEKEVLFRCMY